MDSILTKSGLEVYHTEITKYIQDQIIQSKDSVLEYDSSLLFPSIGKINTIYVDKTGNKSYRWDDTELKYYIIGSNYEDIELINGNSD